MDEKKPPTESPRPESDSSEKAGKKPAKPAAEAGAKPDKPKPAPKAKKGVDEEALRKPVPSKALDRLKEEEEGDAVEEVSFHCAVPIVRIKPDRIGAVCRFLKDDASCRMTLLSSLTGIDMSKLGRPEPRFDVVYNLFSVETGERITLKAAAAEDGEIDSVSAVWRTADWHEREAFDMFGIRFAGHPDLRRILMPYDYDAHPLRKDFPLEGREKDHGYWRKPEDDQR